MKPYWAGIVVAQLFWLPPVSVAADTRAEIKSNNEDLARVRSRIQALNARLLSERGKRDEVREQLERTEQSITEVQGQLKELGGRIDTQQVQVNKAQQDKAKATQELTAHKQALARQLRAAYSIGQRGQVKILLNQDSARTAGRVLHYYDYLNRARSQYLQRIFTQLDTLRGVENQLRAELDGLTEIKSEQDRALALLESTRAERAKTLTRLADRIADAMEEVKAQQANEQRIQSLLQNLKDLLADVPVKPAQGARGFTQLRGQLGWPARGSLLASFGQPKASGSGFNWNGLWIAADEGDPVRAAAAGRVAYAGWMQRYGLILIVEHDQGYYTLYGHLQRTPRSEGERVEAGETLGFAGNTGGHPRNGVYFELRKGRQALNPADWLQK